MFFLKNKIHSIELFAKTNIGKERRTNEDSVASLVLKSQSNNKELNCGILVVADGMGGLELGEEASNIASKKECLSSKIVRMTGKSSSKPPTFIAAPFLVNISVLRVSCPGIGFKIIMGSFLAKASAVVIPPGFVIITEAMLINRSIWSVNLKFNILFFKLCLLIQA